MTPLQKKAIEEAIKKITSARDQFAMNITPISNILYDYQKRNTTPDPLRKVDAEKLMDAYTLNGTYTSEAISWLNSILEEDQ